VSIKKISSLDAAVAFFRETLAAHPERNALSADQALRAGQRRRYPVLYLNHLNDPADTSVGTDGFTLPEVITPDTPTGRLAREVVNLLAPLKMDNPVRPSLGLGRSTGNLVASFGIPLDPASDYAPARTREISDLLRDPEPDPATAGLMPEMRERIALIKANLPPDIKIMLPDLQGPFNLIHAMSGNDAFIVPYTQPAEFREMMARIARLWLGVRRLLLEWIGPERLDPIHSDRICECSVNMISPEMYLEHVLEHDLTITREIGPIHLHHCSGPHVFHVVYKHVPVYSVEAGWIEKASAGSTSVEEVLAAIADRPEVILNIGQELPADFAAARDVVQRHFDLYAQKPRISFGYTGMFWRKRDRQAIRDLHRELDDYWARNYANLA